MTKYYLIHGTIFEKKKIDLKICFIALQLLSETFFILRGTELDMFKMSSGLYVTYPLLLYNFNGTLIFHTAA